MSTHIFFREKHQNLLANTGIANTGNPGISHKICVLVFSWNITNDVIYKKKLVNLYLFTTVLVL